MRRRWQQLLNEQPRYWQLSNWPDIDASALPVPHKALFLRNKRVIAKLLSGEPIATIAKVENVSRSFVSRLILRCLTPLQKDQSLPLTEALLPHHHLEPRRRRQKLPTLSNPSNATGSLRTLLQNDPVQAENVDKYIRATIHHDPSGKYPEIKAFVEFFKRELINRQYPMDQYPFNEPLQGYEALRRLYHRRRNELLLDESKACNMSTITTATTSSPFYSLQIDTHRTDCNATVWVEFNDEEIPLPLSRLSLLVAVEPRTRCSVAMQFSLRQEVNHWDVLLLLDTLTKPFSRPTLTTPGLAYQHRHCFPSDADPTFVETGYSMFQLDNALAHIAGSVRSAICTAFHATCHLGLPGAPKGRNVVEFAFKRLASQLHRLPSTTGSTPVDPRRKHGVMAKKPPRVTLQALAEMILLVLAEENNQPRVALGNHTPLSALLNYRSQHHYRRLAFSTSHLELLRESMYCTVHWNKNEQRKPHINVMQLRYRGPALHKANLINKRVRVEYDFSDMRILHVYRESGEYLGEVRAPRSWQSHPFSMLTLKLINQLVKAKRITAGDPIGGYANYLLKNKDIPHIALEIPRFWQEQTGLSWRSPGAITSSAANVDETWHRLDSSSKSARRIPSWEELIHHSQR